MRKAGTLPPDGSELVTSEHQPVVLVPETQLSSNANIGGTSGIYVIQLVLNHNQVIGDLEADLIDSGDTQRLPDSEAPIGNYGRSGGGVISDQYHSRFVEGNHVRGRSTYDDLEGDIEGFLRFIKVLPSDLEVRYLLKKHCFNSAECFLLQPKITILLLTEIGFPCKVAHDLVVLAPAYCQM